MGENADNDYLIDRDEQRTTTYTGIKSIVAQDLAVDAGSRRRRDRRPQPRVSRELRPRDHHAAQTAAHTRLKALQQGIEPPEAAQRESVAVRPGDFMLPRDVPVAEGAREHRLVGAGA